MPKRKKPRKPSQEQNPDEPSVSKTAIAVCAMIIIGVLTMAGCNMALGHIMQQMSYDRAHTISDHQ